MHHALIHYINTLPPNHILRDIAERTLADLIRDENKWHIPEPKNYVSWRARKCINTSTGAKFKTIRAAAKSLRMCEKTLSLDLRRDEHIYPFRFVA